MGKSTECGVARPENARREAPFTLAARPECRIRNPRFCRVFAQLRIAADSNRREIAQLRTAPPQWAVFAPIANPGISEVPSQLRKKNAGKSPIAHVDESAQLAKVPRIRPIAHARRGFVPGAHCFQIGCRLPMREMGSDGVREWGSRLSLGPRLRPGTASPAAPLPEHFARPVAHFRPRDVEAGASRLAVPNRSLGPRVVLKTGHNSAPPLHLCASGHRASPEKSPNLRKKSPKNAEKIPTCANRLPKPGFAPLGNSRGPRPTCAKKCRENPNLRNSKPCASWEKLRRFAQLAQMRRKRATDARS